MVSLSNKFPLTSILSRQGRGDPWGGKSVRRKIPRIKYVRISRKPIRIE
jgi:hypothetical protein